MKGHLSFISKLTSVIIELVGVYDDDFGVMLYMIRTSSLALEKFTSKETLNSIFLSFS
jgi:hypothetical protein